MNELGVLVKKEEDVIIPQDSVFVTCVTQEQDLTSRVGSPQLNIKVEIEVENEPQMHADQSNEDPIPQDILYFNPKTEVKLEVKSEPQLLAGDSSQTNEDARGSLWDTQEGSGSGESRLWCESPSKQQCVVEPHNNANKSFGCSTCGHYFRAKFTLIEHLKTHSRSVSKPKLFKCKICSKAFSNKSFLTEHKQVHSKVKPFGCSDCGEYFGLKSNLRRHIRNHRSCFRFQCSVCRKEFTRNSSLKVHYLLHSDVKSFNCSDCGRHFRTKYALQVHTCHNRPLLAQLSHNNAQPLQCSVCCKIFSSKAILKRHVVQVHFKVKSVECYDCGKCFSRKSDLKVHTRLHLSKKVLSLSKKKCK